jgi:hypothetical protein
MGWGGTWGSGETAEARLDEIWGRSACFEHNTRLLLDPQKDEQWLAKWWSKAGQQHIRGRLCIGLFQRRATACSAPMIDWPALAALRGPPPEQFAKNRCSPS